MCAHGSSLRSAAALLFLTLAGALSAATHTWTGLGATDDWADAGNWSGGVPTNDGLADVVLAGTVRLTPNVNVPWSINKLTFLNGAGAFVLGGSQLTIGAGGIAQGDNDVQTVNNAIVVGAGQPWTRSSGALVLNGNLSGSGTVAVSNAAYNGIRLGGSNAGYSGTMNLLGGNQQLMLLNAGAMTGGVVVVGGSGANSNFLVSGAGSPGTYTMGVGTGAGQLQLRVAGWGGLAPADADVTWDPGSGGNYALTYGGLDFGWPGTGTPVLYVGNNTGSLLLTGGAKNIYGSTAGVGYPAAHSVFRFALGDDGTARSVTFAGSNVALTRAASGGNLGGSTTVQGYGSLAVSNLNQIFTGNLNLGSNGTLTLDSISWAAFTGARAYGTGAGQWQLNGGGFAARGADLVIGSNPAGFSWDNRDFTLGSTAMANGALYADHKVEIAVPVTLGSSGATTRNILLLGRAYESLTNWSIPGVANEISGQVSGTVGTLDLFGRGGSGWSAGGVLRFANAANDFTGTIRIHRGAVVSFTSDAAFGNPANPVLVTEVGQGCSGMLLFDDVNPGGSTTFTKNFTVNATSDASGGMAGFGAGAGEAVYTGTVDVAGHSSKANLPVHVRSGASLQLGAAGTPATLAQNRGTNMTYNKGGAGELILANVQHTGATPGYAWRLYEGTLTTTTAAGLLTSGTLSWANLVSQSSLPRTWSVTTQDQNYANMTTGQFWDNMEIRVADGITVTTGMASGNLLSAPTGGAALVLRKTGPGTWVYVSPNAPSGFGDAGTIHVDEGVFDVTGNLGWTGLRVSGGTLLAGSSSSFATTDRAFSLDADGGKVGISAGATADVSRGGSVTWTQGTAPVTLAARGNYNLIFANASFPDVNAGSTLLIERDGAGSGEVRIYDTAVSVNGTLGGSGRLQLGSAATGTVTVTGALAPGSSPGTLTIDGNLALASGAVYGWELGVGGTADTTAITGALSLGASTTLQVIGYQWVPASPLDQFDLFTWSGADPGGTTWTIDWSLAGNLYGGSVVTDTNANRIYITGLVPEPTAALLLLGAAAALAAGRRRHRE